MKKMNMKYEIAIVVGRKVLKCIKCGELKPIKKAQYPKGYKEIK